MSSRTEADVPGMYTQGTELLVGTLTKTVAQDQLDAKALSGGGYLSERHTEAL
jgi:hypothetical protein